MTEQNWFFSDSRYFLLFPNLAPEPWILNVMKTHSIREKFFYCLDRKWQLCLRKFVLYKLCACIHCTCIFFTVLYLALAICFHAPIICKSDFVPLFSEETRLLYCGFRSLLSSGLPSKSRIFLPNNLGAWAAISSLTF